MATPLSAIRRFFGGGGAVDDAPTAGRARDTQHLSASQTAREVADWEPRTGSADSDSADEIETITARARDLDRNSGLAQNMRVTTIDNVIGTGLRLMPAPNYRVLGRDADWMAAWSKDAKAHWDNFAGSRFVDADGEDNFDGLTRLMGNGEFLSGSACAVPMWKRRAGTPFRTCVKVIESDRLSNPYGAPESERFSGGVERITDGEISAYHVRRGHPGDIGSRRSINADDWERIPARFPWGRRRFLHVYDKSRPGQSRGIPALSAVLAAFGLHGKYQLTELQSAAVLAKIVQVLETPLTDEQAAALYGGTSDQYGKHRENWKVPMNAGSVVKTPVGTVLKNLDPKRPAPAFVAFMEHIVREMGVGVGLPFELGTRNFSQTNYSSARAALLEAWRSFHVKRERIAYQWAAPVYELWLEEAIDLGIIEGEGFNENRAAWCRAQWIAPSQYPIDRLKHESANEKAFKNGTTTRAKIAAEVGDDWEELAEQRLKEEIKDAEIAMRKKRVLDQLSVQLGVEVPADTPPPPDDGMQSDEDIDRAFPEEDMKNKDEPAPNENEDTSDE